MAMIFGGAYLVAAVVLRWGTHRKRVRKSANGPALRLHVIIAARDEQKALPACLESLRRQTYPAHLWDVTVIDDRSRDATAQLVREVAAGWPALRLVQVRECPPAYGGKQHALAAGIESTNGEDARPEDLILMTDADCIVPPMWVEDFAAAFGPEVGLVAGLATFPSSRSLWVRVQQADLAHLLGAAWGFVGLDVPFSAIGNNLAIRRAAYDEIGGHRAMGFTIAEDCALVQRVARRTRWRAAVAPPSATVLTRPAPTVRAFLHQRARWASPLSLLRGWQVLFLGFVFAHRLIILGCTALWLAGLLPWLWSALSWGAWMLGDALVISRVGGALKVRQMAWISPLVTLWQAFYQPVVGVWTTLMPAKLFWRGSAYGRRG